MIGCLEKTRAINDCYKYTPALSQEIKLTITNYLDDLKTVEEFWNLWKTQTWYLFMYKNFEKRAYNSITPGPGLTKESWTSTLHRDHLQQVSLGWLVNCGKSLRQDIYGCVRISKQGAFFWNLASHNNMTWTSTLYMDHVQQDSLSWH